MKDITVTAGPFKVMYTNMLDGKRYALVDNIDKDTADRVMEQWGDPKKPNFYMGPGMTIEEQS